MLVFTNSYHLTRVEVRVPNKNVEIQSVEIGFSNYWGFAAVYLDDGSRIVGLFQALRNLLDRDL